MGSWSHRPSELFLSIAEFTTIQDHVVPRAVCTQWGTTLKENKYYSNPYNQQLPWLMLPKQEPRCGFYNLSDDKVYEIDVPEAYVNKCCGSSEGWLIVSGKTPSVFMLNPLTRARIELPPTTTLPCVLSYCDSNIGNEYRRILTDYYGEIEETCTSEFMELFGIRKAVLSGHPSFEEEEYTVMSIRSELSFLSYCKNGDDRWTSLRGVRSVGSANLSGGCRDIIYWKELFDTVDSEKLLTCDLRGPFPIFNILLRMYGLYTEEELKDLVHCGGACLEEHDRYDVSYLDQYENSENSDGSDEEEDDEEQDETEEDAEDDDDDNNYDYSFYNGERLMNGTACFSVFKSDFEKQIWKTVSSIGNFIIFVGINCSMSFRAQDFPECKPNHVYFTRNVAPAGHAWEQDLGATDLKTNKVQPFPGCSRLTSLIRPTPLWITPIFILIPPVLCLFSVLLFSCWGTISELIN